jgi:hypothetical protein
MSLHAHAHRSFWGATLLVLAAAVGCADGTQLDEPAAPQSDAALDTGADTAVPDVLKDALVEAPSDAPSEVADAPKEAAEAAAEAGEAGTDAGPDVPEQTDAESDVEEPADAADAEAGCATTEKLCESSCVKKDDPAWGCEDGACEPCALAHATATCAAGCAVGSCESGFADCDSDPLNGCETAVDADPQHCGSCTLVCAFPHADAGCAGGICTLGACDDGYEDCDGQPLNGCEADLQHNPDTCGSCSNVCVVQGGSPVCNAGVCGSSGCNPGLGDCDPNIDGCETDLTSSVAHCGYCGNGCQLANATAQCVASQCKILACAAGFTDCDGQAANGCEVNTQTDPNNCGACGAWCAGYNVVPTCAAGQCQLVCVAGYGDCNGDPTDGCETPLNTTYACGACGKSCSPANAVGQCTGGVCGVLTCNGGFGDCNANPADGCEVNLFADPLHCGNCATVCSSNHGTAVCAGSCSIGCDAGWANCNGSLADGCEAATSNNPLHCGSCSNACPWAPNATPTCNGTTCELTCNAGWADCDAYPDNGCEVNLSTDPLHCGSCTTVCAPAPNSAPTCALSACGVACNAGFGNCDGNVANGCEANLLTDALHCGNCTTSCGTSSCAGGVCSANCTAPMADCDGNPGNGCEVNLNTDPQHCGSCTTQCAGNQACSAGTCAAANHVNCLGTACTNTLAGQALGQSFTNGSPVGTPGNGATYTQQMAIDAANAWPVAGSLAAGACATDSVVAKETANSCAVWIYSGTTAGRVRYNSVKTAGKYCLCPADATTTWR